MKKQIFFVMVLFSLSLTTVRAQKMTVKDSNSNVLMEVIDEGSKGSIMIPDTSAALSSETNKLYNLSGTLMWNGSALGTAGSAGGWTDDGTVVRLTTGTDKVGIGISSPAFALDVKDSLGINGTRLLYLPDQTEFQGTLIVGNGGSSLEHNSSNDGVYNTVVGIDALIANTTGYCNTASGSDALCCNTTGNCNTASGSVALHHNTTGNENTASGMAALEMNTSGSYNTACGSSALFYNTEGNYNTGIGYFANRWNMGGSQNTIIGYEAGTGTPGHNKSGNIFIGYQAGYNEIGDNKLYIENSNSGSPLIWGDFSKDSLVVNGRLTVTSFLDLPNGGTDGYVLTSDASGVGTWQAVGGSGGWTDDGSVVRLTTITDKVGIGISSPAFALDVKDSLGINGTRLLYLPDQTEFQGTLIIGNGGGSLEYNSGSEGRYNTAVGIDALNANTIGYCNTASGNRALYSNTTGSHSTASGGLALYSNTSGHYNTASGGHALYSNTTGSHSTASGQEALYHNTTGSCNTAIGRKALLYNTTGNNNTIIGCYANLYNQEGENSTIIGYEAGRGTSLHDKSGNIFIGYQAGYNETGDNKLYIENSNSDNPLIWGDFSKDSLVVNGRLTVTSFLDLPNGATDGYVLTSDASGVGTWQVASGGTDSDWTISGSDMYSAISGNVGIGDNTPTHKLDVAGKIGINDMQILYLPNQTDFEGTLIVGDGGGSLSHTSGSEGQSNTSVGMGALNANTTGASNTAIGYQSLQANTTGDHNTASGFQSLQANTTGNYNMASGYKALYSNTTGVENTAIGNAALYSNTGNFNTAIGRSALQSNTSGTRNIACGYYALYSNTTGDDNTASGCLALHSNTTGHFNTGIGYQANRYNQEGSNNTIIGYEAGKGTSAHDKSGNVFLGYQAGYNEIGDNKLYIENSDSDTPLIGGDFSVDELYLNGKVGIGTVSPDSKLHIMESDASCSAHEYAQLVVENNDHSMINILSANNKQGWIGFGDPEDNAEGAISYDHETDKLHLYTSDQQRLVVDSDGNVGIGTTSPDSKLDVNGSTGYNQLRMRTSYTPTGTSDTNGNTGDVAWDDGYIYIKTSAGWKRSALSTF